MGCRLQTVLWRPKLTKSSVVFGKSHMPKWIPGWQIKRMAHKTHFSPQKGPAFRVFTFLATLIRGEKSDFKEDGRPVEASLGWRRWPKEIGLVSICQALCKCEVLLLNSTGMDMRDSNISRVENGWRLLQSRMVLFLKENEGEKKFWFCFLRVETISKGGVVTVFWNKSVKAPH